MPSDQGLHYFATDTYFYTHQLVAKWSCTDFRTSMIRNEDVPILRVNGSVHIFMEK